MKLQREYSELTRMLKQSNIEKERLTELKNQLSKDFESSQQDILDLEQALSEN